MWRSMPKPAFGFWRDRMTGKQFKASRQSLQYSQRDLAELWGMGVNGERTIRRWETGERPVNPIAAYCIQMMLDA